MRAFIARDGGSRPWSRKWLDVDLYRPPVVCLEGEEAPIRRKRGSRLAEGRCDQWHRLAVGMNEEVQIALWILRSSR